MNDVIPGLLIASIIFSVILIIILSINCYTYHEVYKTAVDNKNKTWAISLLACNIIALLFMIIIIAGSSFSLIYYKPSEMYDEYLTKVKIPVK